MRISHIKISNILGVEEIEIAPGSFTTISGANESGKTSIIEALKSVVTGGQDATLLRKGAKAGEVVLVLDDGTEIRKRVTEKTTTVAVEKNGALMREPQGAIRAITDALSVNPVEFLTARPKDRLTVLLESLPLKADPKRLAEITGIESTAGAATHALIAIDRVHREVFDDRTGTNRALRDKESTVSQLRGTLPDGEETTAADPSALEAQIAAINVTRDNEFERVRVKLDSYRESREAKLADCDARIEAIRAEKDAIQDWWTDTVAKAQTQRELVTTRHATAMAPVAGRLEALLANASAATRAQATRETIARMQAEAATLKADSERQTKALADLDAYKEELLADLPIKGLAIENGEITRGGVVFDRLNTAQQVEIAVDIAKLRAGKLGVICVDGLESLDSAHFEHFREQAIKSGLQLIVSRVTDGELAITTKG